MGELGRRIESESERKERVALEILELLGEIIEKGTEWDPLKLKAIRDQVQQLLQSIGLTRVDDELLGEIIRGIYSRDLKPKVPAGYPSEQEFFTRHQIILESGHGSATTELRRYPNLDEVINLARADWDKVRARGYSESVKSYLYELGKVMMDERLYRTIFSEDDAIMVNENWHVENGRHRTLALKCLGRDYIADANPSWIEAKLEAD